VIGKCFVTPSTSNRTSLISPPQMPNLQKQIRHRDNP
jgi:hypothetical protein